MLHGDFVYEVRIDGYDGYDGYAKTCFGTMPNGVLDKKSPRKALLFGAMVFLGGLSPPLC